MHLVLHLLPLLPLIAALPHAKQHQQNKKSLSIGFTQRNINPRATSPLERRLRKRQSTSTDDTAELLNDNNVRWVCGFLSFLLFAKPVNTCFIGLAALGSTVSQCNSSSLMLSHSCQWYRYIATVQIAGQELDLILDTGKQILHVEQANRIAILPLTSGISSSSRITGSTEYVWNNKASSILD